MPLWGRNDADANTAPKYHILDNNTAIGNTMFGNVTVGSFTSKAAVGVFGVDSTEGTVSNSVTHSGWVKVTQYTGSVTGGAVTNAGASYSNTDLVVVSGGTVNASFSVSTNATGAIQSITLVTPGSGFKSKTPTVAAANSTLGASAGSGATFSVTVGGRAGRIFMETLVATGSITGDASDDTTFPDS